MIRAFTNQFIRRTTVFFLIAILLFDCSQEIGLPDGKIVEPISCGAGLTAQAGDVIYGQNNYVEYFVGDPNCPIILTAPHGGYELPTSIPDRTVGVTDADQYTQELTRDIANAIFARTGLRPHIIINKLHRIKLDANRPIGEAAQGNAEAQQAWEDYHCFIEHAISQVETTVGKGILWDMHGHGHAINRIEVGYLLDKFDLAESDATLDGMADISSIRSLADESGITFSQLVRGPKSFGTLIYDTGYPAVPSSQDPQPGVGNDFFEGGYTTQRHGSVAGGNISAIQLECNKPGLRDNDTNRKAFASKMAQVVEAYIEEHLGITL
jgi:N-formylglutamate amidohydrolase